MVRFLWIKYVPTTQLFDFATYKAIAENIYLGKGHTLDGVPVAWQGCAYSYVLGFYFKLIGSASEFGGKVLNIWFSIATLIMSWFIYRKMFKKTSAVLTAFTITAFLPNFVSYVNVLGTEVFFTMLLAAVILAQLYFSHNRISYVFIGILIGVATLTRPFMLVYPIVTAGIMWCSTKKLKETLLFLGVTTVAMLLTLSPWTYRNYKIYGRIIPVSYNMGYNRYVNNNANNTTGTWMDLSKIDAPDEVAAQISEILQGGERSVKAAYDLDPLLSKEGAKWISRNPFEFMKLGVLRVKATFFDGANDISQWAMNGLTEPQTVDRNASFYRNVNAATALFDIIYFIISSAAFIFIFVMVKRYATAFFSFGKKLDILTNVSEINIAFFAVISFVFEGQARYSFPVFLFMVPVFVYFAFSLKHMGKDVEDAHLSL